MAPTQPDPLCQEPKRATKDAVAYKPQSAIGAFFAPVPRPPPPPAPGRPPKPQQNRGRPPSTPAVGRSGNYAAVPDRLTGGSEEEPTSAPSAASTACSTGGSNASASKHQGKTSGGKAAATPRTDWSQGDNLVFLSRAVERWLEKTGPVITRDPKISLKHYCAFLDIPYNTFRHYVATDLTKRRKLGNPSGKQKLLDSDVEKFTIDMLRAKDRCNEGLNKRQASQPLEASACTLALATDCTLPRRHPQLSTTRLFAMCSSQAVDMIQDLRPSLSRAQVTRAFDRCIRPANKALLTGIVKAQASTEKRSQITVSQQWRWHQAVEGAYEFLRKHNKGKTLDGKSFGEVMPYFILGGDETGLLASNADVTIIGDKQKKKHEVATAGSRQSITVYRLGSAAGCDGPTAFLPPGKNRKSAFSDDFLIRHGAAAGSTIVMTDSGYMTEAAWVELAPTLAKGIRKMPVICTTTPTGGSSKSSTASGPIHLRLRRWRSTTSTRSCC